MLTYKQIGLSVLWLAYSGYSSYAVSEKGDYNEVHIYVS